MPRVKGPNGLVLDFPESVAAGLLVKPDHVLVEDEPEPEPKPRRRPTKKAAPKPSDDE